MYLLASVMWAKDSGRLGPSTPSLYWFLQHPMTQRHLENCQNKINFDLLKIIILMALSEVKQKVSQNQIRIEGLPGCLEWGACSPALVTTLHDATETNRTES